MTKHDKLTISYVYFTLVYDKKNPETVVTWFKFWHLEAKARIKTYNLTDPEIIFSLKCLFSSKILTVSILF